MLGQYYSVAVDKDLAKPGQFVFPGNHSDVVCGFIYDVYDTVAEIVLFEETELSNVDVIQVFKMTDEWPAMLMSALSRASVEMNEAWRTMIDDARQH